MLPHGESANSTSTAQAPPDISNALYKKVAWRILPIAAIAYYIAIMDRVNIGIAKLEMSADIGLSAAAYGLGAGIFFLGYILLEPFSNVILERVGARVWITRIMLSWGAVTILMSLVQNPTQFYIGRILLGVAEAGFYPGLVFYLATWFPRMRLTRALSLLLIASPIATMTVAPLSAWIITAFDGVAGFDGWRWMFVVQGIPAILVAIAFYTMMVDRPALASWLDGREKAELDSAVPSQGAERRSMAGTLGTAFKNPRVWILGLLLASNYVGLYAVLFWLPTIIASLGVEDLTTVGLLSAIPWAAAVVVTLLLARFTDRRQSHVGVIMIGMTVGAAGLVFSVIFDGNLVTSLIGLSFATALLYAVACVMWSFTNLQLAGVASLAAAVAVVNALASIGSFAGPYVVGLGIDLLGSATAVTLGIAAFAVLCGVLIPMTLRARQRNQVPRTANAT